MTAEFHSGNTVFISYARRDQEKHDWLGRLRQQLEPLIAEQTLDIWVDHLIKSGEDWQREIEKALDLATVAILLVGPAFLASEFIRKVELPALLRRTRDDDMKLLILVTNYCNYNDSVLGPLQAFNDPIRPLEALPVPDQNEILRNFSQQIKKVAEIIPPPNGVRHNLPIKPDMVGRKQELRVVLGALEENERPVILASGFGGVGKSTLAKVAAWTCVKRQEPFKFVVWVDVRRYGHSNEAKPITFSSVLDSIAKVWSSASEIPAIGDLEAKAARVRELLGATHSLLIIDNYESLLESPEEEEMVARFIDSLPIGPSGAEYRPFIRVLITTRVVSPTL